ncbi:immunoglobulin superfamily DCC subclass member 4-like protein [Corchorus capsularis]|uniref:Immunoglobulin superfamily DCC subclass member 4-like protein n=1 Tax=Corchorus capsularis TaxID=210143 RepID=A0A1R3JTN1_COCAP|nr:immunoglobulin superfamily DCC subclass member 4-like protein [Corchorus capsularis]
MAAIQDSADTDKISVLNSIYDKLNLLVELRLGLELSYWLVQQVVFSIGSDMEATLKERQGRMADSGQEKEDCPV